MAIAFDSDDTVHDHSHQCYFSSLYYYNDRKYKSFDKIHVTDEVRSVSVCNYYEENEEGTITYVCGKLYVYSEEGVIDKNNNLTLQKFDVGIRIESSRSLKCLHEGCREKLLPVYLRLNQTYKKILLGLKLCGTHLFLYKVESRTDVVEFIF